MPGMGPSVGSEKPNKKPTAEQVRQLSLLFIHDNLPRTQFFISIYPSSYVPPSNFPVSGLDPQRAFVKGPQLFSKGPQLALCVASGK